MVYLRHFVLLSFVLAVSSFHVTQAQQGAALRIVVIAGEDAVNIIQQRTAVAPIVEVRDVNNLPVGGATVTFAVGQGASFGGASTLTVVTNAAGQATATGLTPTLPGAIKIQATAAFKGQTAAATISQSNYMTASQAAQASTAGAGGSGGGGGISGKALGLIGGGVAVAGAAVYVTTTKTTTPPPTTPPVTTPPATTPPATTPPATTPPPTTPPPTTPPPTTPPPTCTAPRLAPAAVDATAADFSIDITVTSDCAWSTTPSASYMTLDPSSRSSSGTTRLRVAANTSTNRRTGQVTFTAGTATTVLVVNQDGVSPTTYTGSGSQRSVQYAGDTNDGPSCMYTMTLSDINVSITLLGDNATAGVVTLAATETATGSCKTSPQGRSDHTYTLSSGSIGTNSGSAQFSASGSNRFSANVELRATRSGTTIRGDLIISRNANPPLNWSLSSPVTLNAR